MPTKSKSFPIGAAARRELRTVLRQTTDPGVTIANFQKSHSLHAMLARAFHTTPRAADASTSSSSVDDGTTTESLDTDSVLVFLNHLGVTQHQVHKRISNMLTSQLEEEIRKSSGEPLLRLLKSCWPYSTTIPDLRPVLHACLKQLGTDTPLPVLLRLAERAPDGAMQYPEVWHPLPPLLKRLVWEADWDHCTSKTNNHLEALEQQRKTLFAQQLAPWIEQYSSTPELIGTSNLTFVASLRERRLLTTQRRAVGSTQQLVDAAKAVSEIKSLLSNGDSPASSYRPKLLHACLSMLMNTHMQEDDRLHCTLVADILLSGPLPKAYQPVLALARILDESVKEGSFSDAHICQTQQALGQILPTDDVSMEPSNQSSSSSVVAPSTTSLSSTATTATTTTDTEASVTKRLLPTIVTEAIQAMRDADPQSLFLNPVTDAIAPGYSKVISRPMCMKQMEAIQYTSLHEFDNDVKVMFQNCITYNSGNAGQWFRGEARRQHAVFKNDIFPQAKKYLDAQLQKIKPPEVVKRKVGDMEMSPLSKVPNKKRKLDSTLPSLPALSAMLLADPFVLRLILDRLLRSLRIDASKGCTIPVAHRAVPSLLQLLHLSYSSTKMVSDENIYMVPDAGFELDEDDPLPYVTLRQSVPLVLKLCLEAELDKRLASDWSAAAITLPQRLPMDDSYWSSSSSSSPVLVALLQGALVHFCQPGNTNESSLAITFPRFANSIPTAAAGGGGNDKSFFLSLVAALVRHRAKLGKTNRDAIVQCWLERWIMDSPAGHECFIMLLNEWASMGNLILPRDVLIQYSQDAAKKSKVDFGTMWKQKEFTCIREQYEKLLRGLPESYAREWRQDMGVAESIETVFDDQGKNDDTSMEEKDIEKDKVVDNTISDEDA